MKLTDVRFRRKGSPTDTICRQNDGVLEQMLKGFEDEPFAVLRRKWSEVPGLTDQRAFLGDARRIAKTVAAFADRRPVD